MRARLLLPTLFAALLLVAAPRASNAAGCAPLTTVPPDQLITPDKLQLSINPTLPPQQYVDTNGDLQGLNVELGNEIARRLCLEMVHVRMDFPPMIPALQAGRFDGIDTGFSWTEARSKLFYLVPYALQSISVVVAALEPSCRCGSSGITGAATRRPRDGCAWTRSRPPRVNAGARQAALGR